MAVRVPRSAVPSAAEGASSPPEGRGVRSETPHRGLGSDIRQHHRRRPLTQPRPPEDPSLPQLAALTSDLVTSVSPAASERCDRTVALEAGVEQRWQSDSIPRSGDE